MSQCRDCTHWFSIHELSLFSDIWCNDSRGVGGFPLMGLAIWRGGCGLSGWVHGRLSLGLLSQVKSSLEATINLVLKKYMYIVHVHTCVSYFSLRPSSLTCKSYMYMLILPLSSVCTGVCIQCTRVHVFLLVCMYPCSIDHYNVLPPF